MQEIRSSNPPVVTGIFDPNKSRARHHRRIKLDVKRYLSVDAITKLMPANLSILIIIKFIKANNKGFKKLGPFLDHFLHALGVIAFNIKKFSVSFFVYLHGKKNQMVHLIETLRKHYTLIIL